MADDIVMQKIMYCLMAYPLQKWARCYCHCMQISLFSRTEVLSSFPLRRKYSSVVDSGSKTAHLKLIVEPPKLEGTFLF